jgi:PTH1 family peptidyl-tRNA hydrolase
MRLIVGLGNPGTRYERNRHNVGFMAVDEIVRRHGFGPYRGKFQGEIAEGSIGGSRVYALKPQTYMNASGEAVGEAARFYKIAPDEIAVLYDEIDLAPGKLRVKRGGGAAGHNGIRSIDGAIGEDYWRVRIGIGHPGVKELVQPYVLQNFTVEEMGWLGPLLGAVAEALPVLVGDDAPGFMTKVALLLRPPPRSRAAEEKD